MFGPKPKRQSSISRPLRRHSKCAGDDKGRLGFGPNIHFKSTCEVVQGEEVWLRKAANGKEENLMAFQGKKEHNTIQFT